MGKNEAVAFTSVHRSDHQFHTGAGEEEKGREVEFPEGAPNNLHAKASGDAETSSDSSYRTSSQTTIKIEQRENVRRNSRMDGQLLGARGSVGL